MDSKLLKNLATLLKRWGPALAIMLVIFVASSRTKGQVPDYGGYDWSVKKSGHLLIYAGLALAYLWGLTDGRKANWRDAAVAVLLAAAYGASDEFHQTFVAGRGATLVDVGIDAIGALLGVAGALVMKERRMTASRDE